MKAILLNQDKDTGLRSCVVGTTASTQGERWYRFATSNQIPGSNHDIKATFLITSNCLANYNQFGVLRVYLRNDNSNVTAKLEWIYSGKNISPNNFICAVSPTAPFTYELWAKTIYAYDTYKISIMDESLSFTNTTNTQTWILENNINTTGETMDPTYTQYVSSYDNLKVGEIFSQVESPSAENSLITKNYFEQTLKDGTFTGMNINGLEVLNINDDKIIILRHNANTLVALRVNQHVIDSKAHGILELVESYDNGTTWNIIGQFDQNAITDNTFIDYKHGDARYLNNTFTKRTQVHTILSGQVYKGYIKLATANSAIGSEIANDFLIIKGSTSGFVTPNWFKIIVSVRNSNPVTYFETLGYFQYNYPSITVTKNSSNKYNIYLTVNSNNYSIWANIFLDISKYSHGNNWTINVEPGTLPDISDGDIPDTTVWDLNTDGLGISIDKQSIKRTEITKEEVEKLYYPKTGGTLGGNLVFSSAVSNIVSGTNYNTKQILFSVAPKYNVQIHGYWDSSNNESIFYVGQHFNNEYQTVRIHNVKTPISNSDAANKYYVDSKIASYTVPLATSSTRGGVKIGYTANGKNYPVQLSNEQMYVNVPWTDTNTTYSNATTSTAGLMSSTDKSKLDGIATSANNYSHPTTSGNKHIPSGGSSGQILRWSADGTAVWGADNDTTYTTFVKSGSGAKAGLVPAPSTTAGTTKYLREDGTWQVPPDTNTIYTPASATPKAPGTAAVGTSAKYAREDHIHPAQTTVSGNSGTATKLATARTILTDLASTSAVNFDGSANITPGITGTLPISHGGTGETTAQNAANALLIGVPQGTATSILDSTNFITQHTQGENTFWRRPVSLIYKYIRSKMPPNMRFSNNNLGTAISTEQWNNIKAGTFTDMNLGDYWTINNIKWKIVAFDYYYDTKSTVTKHHILLMPEKILGTSIMVAESDNGKGYLTSVPCLTYISSVIPSAFNNYLVTCPITASTTVNNTAVTSYSMASYKYRLLSEIMVFGCKINSIEKETNDTMQLPYFKAYPNYAISNTARQSGCIWLRDYGGGFNYCVINSSGVTYTVKGNLSAGILPIITIGG